MDHRLNFSLPEFTRIVWASELARTTWEPRIREINNLWMEIEKQTVISNMRQGGLQTIRPGEIVKFQRWCMESNLEMVMLGQEGVPEVYGNSATQFVPSKPWAYRVYFGRDAAAFLKFWEEKDQQAIGFYLGYPICCTAFFQKWWDVGGWRDLTFPMAGFRSGLVSGPFRCNILLRHLGVRSVFHLPCSFNCEATSDVGEAILAHGIHLGYIEQVRWIMEMLNWPARWSSLHGVAIITTPVVKVITSSDALAIQAIVDYDGPQYPMEGETGVEFPFQHSRPRLLSIENLKDVWTDNGFNSHIAQNTAHETVLRAVGKILFDPGKILDLGCGNGLLLERIKARHSFLEPYGVEMDDQRYWKAVERIGKDQIFAGDIFNIRDFLPHNYQLVLISVNRLREVKREVAETLVKHLRACTKYLVVYSYGDWDVTGDNILAENFDHVWQEHDLAAEVKILKPKS